MKYALILLVLFTSCRTPQQKLNRLLKKHPELLATRSDTLVRVDTVYTDTSINIPADSASLDLPADAKQGKAKRGRASASFKKTATGRLLIDCKCDSLQLRLRIRHINRTVRIDSQQTITKEVERRKGFWHWLSFALAVFGALSAGIFIGRNLRR